MGRKRRNAEEIVAILRESDRGESTVEELCRKHGITDQTYYRWKKQYGGVGETEVRKMRKLETENRRLKQVIGDKELALELLKEELEKKGYA